MYLPNEKANLLEADIEQALFESPNMISFVDESGETAFVTRWLHRQLAIPNGILDLLGASSDGGYVVVEVKLGTIDGRAASQVCRYARDIEIIAQCATKGYETAPVYKVVVGNAIEEKSIHECLAMNVHHLVYSVRLSLSMNSYHWTDKAIEQMRGVYNALSEDESLASVQREWDERFELTETTAEDAPDETDVARLEITECQDE